MLEKELYDFSNTIKTENLKKGVYFITVYTKGKLQTLKLQINN
jgi:hypothetical protein